MTPSGFEPTTFQLVAQSLYELRHRVLLICIYLLPSVTFCISKSNLDNVRCKYKMFCYEITVKFISLNVHGFESNWIFFFRFEFLLQSGKPQLSIRTIAQLKPILASLLGCGENLPHSSYCAGCNRALHCSTVTVCVIIRMKIRMIAVIVRRNIPKGC